MAAGTVRVGMIEDVDTLDPAQGRTLGGRHVFTALCDKLFDIDEKVNINGRLVTEPRDLGRTGSTVTLASCATASSSTTARRSTPRR